jgi:hypothetical protein
MGDYSDILYARPSFLEGMARALDLGGTLQEYNQSPTGAMADGYALRADWRAVGQDLTDAFDRVKHDVDAEGAARVSRE